MIPDMRKLADEAAKDGIVRFSAGALIHNESQVLLLRRKPDDFLGGLWELPSGQVEEEESIEDAAVREVLEETGLTVTSITGYLGSFDFIASDGSPTREFTFTVAVNPAEVVLTEHDAYQWAHPDHLPEMSKAVRGIVERWAATTPAKKRPAAVASAHLILSRDGRVLLGRRRNTGWNDGLYQVPSGHVEHESASAAVIREAQEEAGISVTEVRCVHNAT
ncbi:MAG: NUDIX hydrolase [Streptomycetaceae bacterium]|nr:NUDIX hydrolase [Streptomycetaceae bacterium]